MANPAKIQAEVSNIISHGDGVFTITFIPLKKVPRFKPGQFLHLTLDDYDIHGGFWPESRVFSIASSYNNKKIILVYSTKGGYTSRMADELKVGNVVWLKLPYGNFIINSSTEENQDVILVAGGTGISPFLSYLETELHNPSNRKIRLVYGIRKKSHLLFKELLNECLNKMANFTIDLYLEEYTESIIGLKDIVPSPGQISLDKILHINNNLNSPVIFLSGPPLMITLFKNRLLESGVNENNIKVDEWE